MPLGFNWTILASKQLRCFFMILRTWFAVTTQNVMFNCIAMGETRSRCCATTTSMCSQTPRNWFEQTFVGAINGSTNISEIIVECSRARKYLCTLVKLLVPHYKLEQFTSVLCVLVTNSSSYDDNREICLNGRLIY